MITDLARIAGGLLALYFGATWLVGAAAALRPLEASELQPVALWGMLALCALAAPVMWRGFEVTRAEGALLVAGYGVFLAAGLLA